MLSTILLFTIAGILYKVFRMQKCPTESEIRRAILLKRKDRSSERIISHLGICESCRTIVDKINDNQ